MSGNLELLVGGVLCVVIVLVGVLAVQCTMLLGAISSSCDDLAEDLNKIDHAFVY